MCEADDVNISFPCKVSQMQQIDASTTSLSPFLDHLDHLEHQPHLIIFEDAFSIALSALPPWPGSAVKCSVVQYSAVQCSVVQCSAVQRSAMQCSLARPKQWPPPQCSQRGSAGGRDLGFLIKWRCFSKETTGGEHDRDLFCVGNIFRFLDSKSLSVNLGPCGNFSCRGNIQSVSGIRHWASLPLLRGYRR